MNSPLRSPCEVASVAAVGGRTTEWGLPLANDSCLRTWSWRRRGDNLAGTSARREAAQQLACSGLKSRDVIVRASQEQGAFEPTNDHPCRFL
jgi:hypothetical protein